MKNLLFLFFVSPVLALYGALKTRNLEYLKRAIILFFASVGGLYVYSGDADGASHLETVHAHYMDMTVSEFLSSGIELLFFIPQPYGTEVYKHVISFLSGYIFGFPELLHVFAGAALGYFFANVVGKLYNEVLEIPRAPIILLLISAFLLIRSIGAMNSIRMWTGMWALLFFALKFWEKKTIKNGFLTVLIPSCIHFSYLFLAVPVLVAYKLRAYKKLIIVTYFLSFFTSIGLSAIENWLPSDNELYQRKSGYVYDDRRLEEREQMREKKNEVNGPIYVKYGSLIYFNFSIYVLSGIVIVFLLKVRSDQLSSFFGACGLLFLSISNSSEFSPSVSGRSRMIGATFLLASTILFIVKHYNSNNWRGITLIKTAVQVYLVSSIPYLVYNIVYVLLFTSSFIFAFPILSVLAGDLDISISQLIGILRGK